MKMAMPKEIILVRILHILKLYILEYFLAYQDLLPLSACMINDICLKNVFVRMLHI